MTDLVGEYRHKLDAKGRLSLPADFRKVLPKSLKITLSPNDDSLYVFDPEGFSAWVDSLFDAEGGYSPSNSTHAAIRKVLNSRARNVEVDSAGRIVIAADMRGDAGLDRDVAVVGDSDHFEIWDAKRWDEFCSSVNIMSLFKK